MAILRLAPPEAGFRPIPRPPASGSWPSDPERTRGTDVGGGATGFPRRGSRDAFDRRGTLSGVEGLPMGLHAQRAPRPSEPREAAQISPLPWSRGLTWFIALVPVLWWIAAFWYAHRHPSAFIELTKEDGWVENTQVVFFASGAMLARLIGRELSRMRWRSWARVYRLAAIGLVWVIGEEISWGQRLFGWTTPAWIASHNLQGELNVHNLVGVGWGISHFISAGVLGTLVLSWGARRRWRAWYARHRSELWVPHPILIPAALCYLTGQSNLVDHLARWYPAASWDRVSRGFQEARELVLAFAVLLFSLVVHVRLRQERRRAHASSLR
ncbi:MAG: hypothetical protein HYZ89_06545 [Candidatus Omnitrophica bacterium]|nr:hypothetical protein [Candidatus Omnitrophota bacterium]